MATPAPRRSARIAANAAAAAAAPVVAAAVAAAPVRARAPVAAAAAVGGAGAPAAPVAPAAFMNRDEIIGAAKKIVADLKNPAIPAMPDAERIAAVTEIMARMRKVCHDAGMGMETLFIADARNYCLVVCGEMKDFVGHGYAYDKDFNEIKLPAKVMYARYCKEAARVMGYFIRDF